MAVTKLGVVLLGIVALVGCSGNSSPTTGSSTLSVSNAAVLVGGVPVQGTVTQGTGDRALFQVRVTAPEGLSTVARVIMKYLQPGPNHHGGHVMGGYSGTVFCYDDGSHGDDIPGDGMYHYMDPDDQTGCHGLNAPMGEYHYRFWAEHMNGQRSNTVSLIIVRE